jgi:hypothetical protein
VVRKIYVHARSGMSRAKGHGNYDKEKYLGPGVRCLLYANPLVVSDSFINARVAAIIEISADCFCDAPLAQLDRHLATNIVLPKVSFVVLSALNLNNFREYTSRKTAVFRN